MVRWEKDLPKTGKVMEDCMNILLEEIRQAVAWSRPSILVAVHKSKNDQTSAVAVMEHRFGEASMKVVSLTPVGETRNIFHTMAAQWNSQETIFFVHGLGQYPQTYAGLNMYRESIVENKIKVIFWLTLDEMVLLSRLAPDFWAFRHRVIEFPTGRNSRKNNLPAGVLLWPYESSILSLDTIRKRIAFQKELLQNVPFQVGTAANHVQAVEELAYCLWFIGENQAMTALLLHEIERIKSTELIDLHSMLLNMLAINSFDQDNPYDALMWIEQALDLTPTQSLLWSNHGVISRSARQGKKSLPSLKRAIKLAPSSYKGWGVLGYAYMSLGRYSDALFSFEKALVLNSESTYLLPALAFCHNQKVDTDEFHKTIHQLSNLAKGDDYLSICRMGLSGEVANALFQLNELILGEKIPRTFIRRDPNLRFIFGVSALQKLL